MSVGEAHAWPYGTERGIFMSVAYGTKSGDTYWQLRGLSSDEKPTEGVPNGSTFEEIDTGNEFMFDADGKIWHPTKQSSSAAGAYSVPVATETTVGGIKESDTVIVDEDGTAHAKVGEDSFATDEEVEGIITDVFGGDDSAVNE